LRRSPAACTRTRRVANYQVGSSGERSAVRRTGDNSANVLRAFLACAFVLMAAATWASAARTIKPSRSLLRDDSFCLGCHAPESLAKGAKPVAAAVVYRSAHRDLVCVDCHRDLTDVHHAKPPARADCAICHTEGGVSGPAAGRKAPGHGDLHSLSLPRKGERAPTCTACHGKHDASPVLSASSRLAPARIAATCGACHSAEARQYSESVHGVAAGQGNKDVPTCSTCHPEHIALGRTGVLRRGVVTTCVSCHENPGLQSKYALPGNRLASYLGSYHGAASELGDNRVANCTSCHSVHDILPSTDPRSTVNPADMPRTCGRCHPGVSGRFGTARVHLQPSLRRDRLIFLVKTGYQVFIGGLISSFVGYIALDLLARRRRRFPATRRSAAAHPQPEFERLSLDQRIQHWLLMASFITLMVTGLPLTSPSWAVSRSLVRFLGGMGVRAIIHRTAAVVLIGLACYHLLYVLFSRRGYRDFWQLRPTLQDGRDLLRMLRFYLGYSTVPARFGRYNYIEKFEYLAVGWGSVVMVTTGLLLWAPGVSLSVVPKWVMDVALVVHGWEAILAFLAIIIWHMYNVHWNPAVFPMSRVWLTGRISLDELRDNHPLEYDRMQLGGRLPQEDAP